MHATKVAIIPIVIIFQVFVIQTELYVSGQPMNSTPVESVGKVIKVNALKRKTVVKRQQRLSNYPNQSKEYNLAKEIIENIFTSIINTPTEMEKNPSLDLVATQYPIDTQHLIETEGQTDYDLTDSNINQLMKDLQSALIELDNILQVINMEVDENGIPLILTSKIAETADDLKELLDIKSMFEQEANHKDNLSMAM